MENQSAQAAMTKSKPDSIDISHHIYGEDEIAAQRDISAITLIQCREHSSINNVLRLLFGVRTLALAHLHYVTYNFGCVKMCLCECIFFLCSLFCSLELQMQFAYWRALCISAIGKQYTIGRGKSRRSTKRLSKRADELIHAQAAEIKM